MMKQGVSWRRSCNFWDWDSIFNSHLMSIKKCWGSFFSRFTPSMCLASIRHLLAYAFSKEVGSDIYMAWALGSHFAVASMWKSIKSVQEAMLQNELILLFYYRIRGCYPLSAEGTYYYAVKVNFSLLSAKGMLLNFLLRLSPLSAKGTVLCLPLRLSTFCFFTIASLHKKTLKPKESSHQANVSSQLVSIHTHKYTNTYIYFVKWVSTNINIMLSSAWQRPKRA